MRKVADQRGSGERTKEYELSGEISTLKPGKGVGGENKTRNK
jgi:hypothetical protein